MLCGAKTVWYYVKRLSFEGTCRISTGILVLPRKFIYTVDLDVLAFKDLLPFPRQRFMREVEVLGLVLCRLYIVELGIGWWVGVIPGMLD